MNLTRNGWTDSIDWRHFYQPGLLTSQIWILLSSQWKSHQYISLQLVLWRLHNHSWNLPTDLIWLPTHQHPQICLVPTTLLNTDRLLANCIGINIRTGLLTQICLVPSTLFTESDFSDRPPVAIFVEEGEPPTKIRMPLSRDPDQTTERLW